MANSGRENIQAEFADRCEELLDVMIEHTRSEDTWDLYLEQGAGARAIAGDHEERHLLELLQNARDAIYRGRLARNASPGRVFVAVTEHGMAMANTGAPFRLNDEEVLKAVRFLQRSDKANRGFIGYKGVGLKSILLRAGAFSVRSRINGQMLRATFSRSRTAQRLLEHLDQNPDSVSVEQATYIRQQLPRLPLFAQPHADSAYGGELGEDAPLIEALLEDTNTRKLGLDESGKLTSLAPYTTVVYLPYRDERWEQQLEATKKRLSHGGQDAQAAFDQARQQTGIVSGRANADDAWRELIKLDRRMLVLLGEIRELQFARFDDGVPQNVHRIGIETPLSPVNEDRDARPRRIPVRERRWPSSSDEHSRPERLFTVLSAPTHLGAASGETSNDQGPREHIRILLENPDAGDLRFRSEPLFLYYPIETEQSGLPFLIHGPFRVNSSRTALVRDQRAHNWEVLKEAVELLDRQLPALLEESGETRPWLPWILLPLMDPKAEGRTEDSELSVELCRQVIRLLRGTESVPTTAGTARPESVNFFPNRPDALLLLEQVPEKPGSQESDLRLLAPPNRETYKMLYEDLQEKLSQAALRIGLGRTNLRSFAEALVSHLGERGEKLQVDKGRASEFFLNLCDLFGQAESDKLAEDAAEILGEHGIPLLPSFAGDAQGQAKELFLVAAENRVPGGSEKLQKASRVVFWRPASVESRFEEIPAPPESIPVFFMDPSVITAEGAKAEGILSTFYEEWGTTRFESRPDLFRRVADRAVELRGEVVLPVVGYLADLLHSITSESYRGADDLKPRPYGAIDLETVGNAVRQSSSRAQRPYWERLESLQHWAQIQVPVQGEREFAPAEDVVFGAAWADVLRAFVSGTEADEEGDVLPEERWAEAIDKLLQFREEIGRGDDHPDYPELAPPDDDCWQDAERHLRRRGFPSGEIEGSKALFDLLLLLGVRIGPRVEWRWLDTRSTASRFDALSLSVSKSASRALFAGEILDEDDAGGLPRMARSETARAYCDHITLKPYHTFFSGGHSRGCRRDLSKTGDGESALAAWIWFPDLTDIAPESLPFDGCRSRTDAFRESVLAVWPGLSQRVLRSGWYCCRGWHKGRRWEKPIPSLAAFQLSRLALWPARPDGHIPDIEERRFPASVMVAWEAEESPSQNDAVRFFPLFDTHRGFRASVAEDLQIKTLAEIGFLGAVLRLHWLLDESCIDDEAPAACWPIEGFGNVSQNVWLTAQYRLLARIVDEDPESLWSRKTALIGGLALRAVRDDNQIAVPVVAEESSDARFPGGLKLAYFSQSPRYWEREEHADKWILMTRSELQAKLYRWARSLGAEQIPRSRPPAYTGNPIDAPEALRALRREVRDRLSLLLGVFRAHQAEKLEEMATTVLDAMGGLQAVKPDAADEAGSSGLDEGNNLVFSYPAYVRADEASRAVILAEGIALLVDQTTAVGDLQNALGAPPSQVEAALHFRGIDLDDIVRSVSSLSRERLQRLKERIGRLIRALGEATGSSAPPRISWKADEGSEDDGIAMIHSLHALEGPVAEQALDGIQSAAPDLTREARENLLRETIDDSASATASTRHLLAILRESDWSIERRKEFAECDLFQGGLDLGNKREAIDATLSVVITVALIEQLQTGELDGVEDIVDRLASLGRDMRDRVSPEATDTGADFIRHLEAELNVPVGFEPPNLLLIEWEEEIWKRLEENLQATGNELVSEVPDGIRDVMKQCLELSSLSPIQEGQHRVLDKKQRRIRALERSLDRRTVSFDPEAMMHRPSPELELSTETSRPGDGGGGPVTGVTSDQAVRGRVAELFVLEACWIRFLRLDRETRRQVLEEIASRRQEGSGRGENHARWSTKTAWEDLEQRLKLRQEALVSCPEDETEVPSDLAKLFKDLIEVANERGPGYDILDPSGLWGSALEAGKPDPCRVEVKAVLRDIEKAESYRVVLTTNEYHRACRDPGSYVLRLISVPRDPEKRLDQVRWVCDIPNPVQALKLDEQIGKGVRGGTLPLALQLRAEVGDQA
jgi:hypothetical protein